MMAASDKNSAAILEGFHYGFAVFVSMDSLAEGSMLSGHVYFHCRCFLGV